MTDIKNKELKLVKEEYTKCIKDLVENYNSNMGDYISEEVDNHDVMIEDYYNDVDNSLDKLSNFLYELKDKFDCVQYNRVMELLLNVREEVENIDSVFSEYKDTIKDNIEWNEDSISNIVNDTDTIQDLKKDITNLLELKDRKDTLEYEINYYSKLK